MFFVAILIVALFIFMGWLFGKWVAYNTTCDKCEMKELCKMCREDGEVPPCEQNTNVYG